MLTFRDAVYLRYVEGLTCKRIMNKLLLYVKLGDCVSCCLGLCWLHSDIRYQITILETKWYVKILTIHSMVQDQDISIKSSILTWVTNKPFKTGMGCCANLTLVSMHSFDRNFPNYNIWFATVRFFKIRVNKNLCWATTTARIKEKDISLFQTEFSLPFHTFTEGKWRFAQSYKSWW